MRADSIGQATSSRIPGESRGPSFRRSHSRQMGPGFRRDCDL